MHTLTGLRRLQRMFSSSRCRGETVLIERTLPEATSVTANDLLVMTASVEKNIRTSVVTVDMPAQGYGSLGELVVVSGDRVIAVLDTSLPIFRGYPVSVYPPVDFVLQPEWRLGIRAITLNPDPLSVGGSCGRIFVLGGD